MIISFYFIFKISIQDGLFYLFIYSFFNVDNYRTNTVCNTKNSNKMIIDVNTLVKNLLNIIHFIKNEIKQNSPTKILIYNTTVK